MTIKRSYEVFKNDFYRFLKENGYYGKFMYNFKQQRKISDITEIEKFLRFCYSENDKEHIKHPISYAFIFINTSEGVYFWDKASLEYDRHFRLLEEYLTNNYDKCKNLCQ